MWDMEEAQNISGKNRKRRSMRMKVDLYKFCLPYILYCLMFYFITRLNRYLPPPPPRQIYGISLTR